MISQRLTIESDPTIDQEQLETQVRMCRASSEGTTAWFLHLIGKENEARFGVLLLNQERERERVYEQFPLHGVNHGRGSNDSYNGLVSILENGFSSLFRNDPNTLVMATANEDYLAEISRGVRVSIFGERSGRPRTRGDRYFLEFKSFSPQHDWKSMKPTFMGHVQEEGGIRPFCYLSVSRATSRDLRVNVIPGSTEPEEVTMRIESIYKPLFSLYGVEYRFYTNGLIS